MIATKFYKISYNKKIIL